MAFITLPGQAPIAGTGTVKARADYPEGESKYCVRFKDGKGEDQDEWLTENLLRKQVRDTGLSDAKCDLFISALCPDFEPEADACDLHQMRQYVRNAWARATEAA